MYDSQKESRSVLFKIKPFPFLLNIKSLYVLIDCDSKQSTIAMPMHASVMNSINNNQKYTSLFSKEVTVEWLAVSGREGKKMGASNSAQFSSQRHK